MSVRQSDTRGEGSAAAGGAPRLSLISRLIRAFSSVRLALWLLAILAIAMAVATFIPQRAPEEAYLKVFGTLLGPLIAKTTLQNIYGSWWFVGAFALLSVNLLACSIRRIGQLKTPRTENLTPTPSLRARKGGDRAARGDAEPVRGEVRSPLRFWTPVIVHVGMIVVLIGAAWGRFPSHAYQATAIFGSGEAFEAQPPGEPFDLRLNEAGAVYSSTGQPKRFWAKLDILENGHIVKSQTVEPNRPLRHRGVSVTLQSVMPGRYAVAVVKGRSVTRIPVALGEDGQVDMMASFGRPSDPPWIVLVHSFREEDESGHSDPAARVFIDRSGTFSHNWESVGWVGVDGLSYKGVHFMLVGGTGAQLSLDRDIGVPIVYFGFIVVSIGVMLMLGPSRRKGERTDG